MNIHRRPRLAKYRTLSNALLFVRRSLSRLFAISLRNSIDTQQRMKWKMDWYRPGQQTLNHITLIKVIICIYIYTRHSTIMSFDSTDVRFTCTNRRKNENHFHVFVQQQFSHFVQHNSCVRQSAIFAFIFFAKKEDWAHTHTHQRPFKCTWIVHSRFSFAKSRWKFQMMTALKRRTESFILRWQIIFYSYIDQIWFSTLHLFYTHFPLTFFLFSLATLSSF